MFEVLSFIKKNPNQNPLQTQLQDVLATVLPSPLLTLSLRSFHIETVRIAICLLVCRSPSGGGVRIQQLSPEKKKKNALEITQ